MSGIIKNICNGCSNMERQVGTIYTYREKYSKVCDELETLLHIRQEAAEKRVKQKPIVVSHPLVNLKEVGDEYEQD